jgi:ribosomal protein S12 methylthiotransferase
MVAGIPPVSRVYFHTLGCPKNDADSRVVMRQLVSAGAVLVEDPAECTHIVINTCGFIRDAKEESIEAILSVCGQYPGKRVMVMGCLVKRYREELVRGIPEVAGWFGVAQGGLDEQLAQAILGDEKVANRAAAVSGGSNGAYAYIKISDGCDEACTFCAIPGIKGPYRSVTTADIVREAEACLAEGARELVLVGQDTTRWRSEGLGLRGLVDLLCSDARLRWLRVMYLQPARVSEPFLEFMAAHPKLCRYLDVPFQHSHGQVLRRMGRKGDGEAYLALLDRARQKMPEVSLRSTFIVGFPGETERHFEHLLGFVEKARFDYGGGFVYSPEEGTAAAGLRPRVGSRVAARRLDHLNATILQIGEEVRGRMVGHELEVMVDSIGGEEGQEGADAVGRTRAQAPEVDGVTYIKGILPPGLVPGDVVRVRVSDVVGCDLVGEICAS